MEKKNNKGVVALLIVINIILLVLCVLFATGTISINFKDVDDNINESNNKNNEEPNLRTLKCFSEIGSQFGISFEKTTYQFENNKIKTISMADMVVLTGMELTGEEYKESKYLLNNFCINNDKCVSKQYGELLYRNLDINFQNQEDLNTYVEYKDISIEQILNNSIKYNDLASRHQECFETK